VKPDPLIIYIPGLLPKPEPEMHRNELLRCLLEGVRRIDPEVADDLSTSSRCFDLVSWTYDFYEEHRDIALDLPDIEDLLRQQGPTEQDIAEAVSWKRRLLRMLYKAVDVLPFLVPKLASGKVQLHLRDLRRYIKNDNEIAELIRRRLMVPLEAASLAGRPILLLAHSMGSVIAYDALWQLSRKEKRDVLVDQLLTMGSPLGQKFIQQKLQGYKEQNESRYPDNVRRWLNISAIGELTALDTELKNDFGEMERLGLVEWIKDLDFFNFYRLDGVLNVHAEYGYLINEVTAREIRDWWCKQR
jgi:hypothetical protein